MEQGRMETLMNRPRRRYRRSTDTMAGLSSRGFPVTGVRKKKVDGRQVHPAAA